MSYEASIHSAAALALLCIIVYAILGGADFGGGVWDLLAFGPRRSAQRMAIKKAMGPVWEANHVWLIFLIVILFTCFPHAYAPLGIGLFVPFHLALLGIMLRGASFVFRGFTDDQKTMRAKFFSADAWGVVFGIASIISPFLLGAAFGAITEGKIRVTEGNVEKTSEIPWLSSYAICCGLLAQSACAYLAAVYLTVETDGELREDFRTKAIFSGTSTAALAIVVLVLARMQAIWFFKQLISVQSLPVFIAGGLCLVASAWSVFGRRYVLSRFFAASEIALMLIGWGLAHKPYIAHPDLDFTSSAAPQATIEFLLYSVPVGVILLGPSLWLLFSVFKSDKKSMQEVKVDA